MTRMRCALLIAAAAFVSGCSTARAMNASTVSDIQSIDACVSRSALARRIGGADRTIAIPGGGLIEVHDVLVKPSGAGVTSALVSASTLGMWDLAAGAVDAGVDCGASYQRSSSPGGGLRVCDYKHLQFFVHYADAGSQQMACWEMREVWAGNDFISIGDDSKCPSEYKAALSQLVDTADFPTALHSWATIAGLPAYQQLQAMTADHRANCPA